MSKIYVVNTNGSSEPMAKIHCVNEDLELQRILELNPDLLPGDQINPANPRRWLIVKREMPVPDPSTGGNRWSIDLFFVDQDAMPTFIECKRYKDTRSKREVVGQMLDYAANGHYYWSQEEIREYATQAALANGLTIEEEIKRLQPEEPDSLDVFFQRIQDNLREGQVRLVFFMEEAPQELKSVVDFLNKQMERSEVLIVEARQYEYQGNRIVSPILFGFTEEARMIKKTVSVTSSQVRRKWDKDSFFSEAKEILTPDQLACIRSIYEKVLELRCEINWGTGKVAGSFSVKWPHLGKYSLFSIYTNGYLVISYGSFGTTREQEEFRSFLKNTVTDKLALKVPNDYEKRYPNYKIEEWAIKTEDFLNVIDLLLEKYPETISLV